MTYVVSNQPKDISNTESVTNRGRDVIGGIQPKFMCQSTSPCYYELVEHWEVDENTNVDVATPL